MSPVAVRGNRYHPTRDVAILTEPWTVDELMDAARTTSRPVAHKAVPGTSEHERLMAAGGHIYQQCPPLGLDASTPAVLSWCEAHSLLPVESGMGVDLLELWTTWYEVIHESWSPTAPHDRLLELFGPLVQGLDPERTSICRVDGAILAVAFFFPDDQPPEVLTEALVPEHPHARTAVASCMARVLAQAEGEVRFDGHVGDPHFFPLLQTLPGVYADASAPLDLIEIRPVG